MSNMFSRNLLRHSAKLTKSKFDEIKLLFDHAIGGGDTATATTVNIQDMFFRLTMDVTCKTVFDVDLRTIQNVKPHPFAVAFDELQWHLNVRNLLNYISSLFL